MGYLSPFTDGIFQFFYSWLRLPTILYVLTSLAVAMIGLMLYWTSTDFDLNDILSLLPRTIVSVQKRLDKRRVGAIFLIVLGLMGLFTFSDRLNVEAQTNQGGGGPVIPAISCLVNNPSPCWTLIQHGTFLCTIPNGGLSCSQPVTFSPAYSTVPIVKAGFNGTFVDPDQVISLSFNTPDITPLTITGTNNTAWTVPRAAFTELFNAPDNRVSWITPAGMLLTNQMARFCVDIAFTASSTSTSWHLDYSTDQSTWTTLAITLGTTAAGLTCSQNTLLANGIFAASTTYYFRIEAKFSGLSPNAENIGTISIQLSNLVLLSTTQNVPVPCAATYDTPTVTTVNIDVACGDGAATLGTTMQVNWWAGIPA